MQISSEYTVHLNKDVFTRWIYYGEIIKGKLN